ncbi:MAG: NAD-dependent epimerase/dehydratase family protein, partial [Bacteroidota bacterium]|nr:NAD-dependent epimerase/dehydratase family protein [Bacteroidota bacterium]
MNDANGLSEITGQPPNVLVSGAAGLLGTELVRQLLAAGHRVTALVHQRPLGITDPLLTEKKCDILDTAALEECMKGITEVYHCAGLVSFQPRDKQRLFKINVEGTASVVNACLEASVRRLVHVSSVAALGRIREGVVVDESMTWTEETSNSTYGKSKYLGELEVWRGIGEGLRAVIVNPTIILGPASWDEGSSALFKSAFDEFKWYTTGIGGFVDVRDVSRAMILLMQSDLSAQRYIISSENLSYKEVLDAMAANFGKRPPFKKVTPFMASLVWRMEAVKGLLTGKNRLLTRETSLTAQAVVKFNNRKILDALPSFQFTSVN